MGLSPDEVATLMEQNRQTFNATMPPYSRLSAMEIQDSEFEKTPKKSIKRYLYK